MSRTHSLISLCVLSGLLLAGCSSNNASNSGASTAPTASATSSASAPVSTGASSTAPADSASASQSAAPSESALPSEKPLEAEKSPLGDIPDSQAFVKYKSQSGGYSVEVPEGWARTENGVDVSFINKLDGVKVSVAAADQAPTKDSVKTGQAADLEKNGRAVKIAKIAEVALPNGKAIKVSYTANSEPNAITGKQVRLDNEVYYYYKAKKLVALTVWAPLGADNVDQWNRMSESFGWDAK